MSQVWQGYRFMSQVSQGYRSMSQVWQGYRFMSQVWQGYRVTGLCHRYHRGTGLCHRSDRVQVYVTGITGVQVYVTGLTGVQVYELRAWQGRGTMRGGGGGGGGGGEVGRGEDGGNCCGYPCQNEMDGPQMSLRVWSGALAACQMAGRSAVGEAPLTFTAGTRGQAHRLILSKIHEGVQTISLVPDPRSDVKLAVFPVAPGTMARSGKAWIVVCSRGR